MDYNTASNANNLTVLHCRRYCTVSLATVPTSFPTSVLYCSMAMERAVTNVGMKSSRIKKPTGDYQSPRQGQTIHRQLWTMLPSALQSQIRLLPRQTLTLQQKRTMSKLGQWWIQSDVQAKMTLKKTTPALSSALTRSIMAMIEYSFPHQSPRLTKK